MAKEKTIKGTPFGYVVDLSHKTLGKFDDNGVFKTDDPDTIRRLEMMEEHEANLKKKPLGEQLAEQNRAAQYAEQRKLAEIIVEVLIERGVFKGK